MICRFIFSQTSKPRPGICPAIRKVSKDFCARAFIVSDCKGKDSDCPKGIPLQTDIFHPQWYHRGKD
jgi:hypothetical protein